MKKGELLIKGVRIKTMQKIFNKTEYKERRQTLGSDMTEPEQRLWSILKNKQMGVKFRRQHGIGHYIVDFYSSEIKLVIEVDGESHGTEEAQAYDQIRENDMVNLGLYTLRFSNQEVMQNLQGVFDCLQRYINDPQN
ncbi:endonuclease domain-containing protein [Acinetobacter sp. TGL-Y2]|uniref:endonuclease domain-containing protein n=1 Tax=Acinetobacter sp. TGL-Y2 TaxID=1407071 RepID=UPI000A7C2F5A|nr:endonuclease domain-containing protein [Acinetobacter sp. TGL-Y2]